MICARCWRPMPGRSTEAVLRGWVLVVELERWLCPGCRRARRFTGDHDPGINDVALRAALALPRAPDDIGG